MTIKIENACGNDSFAACADDGMSNRAAAIWKGQHMDIQLKRGMLEACVLGVLARGESYGYLIVKDLQPFVEISESTLYPILRRLENGGQVTVRKAEHNGRLRKYYSITDAGREKIKEFLKDWEEIHSIYEYVKGGLKENE